MLRCTSSCIDVTFVCTAQIGNQQRQGGRRRRALRNANRDCSFAFDHQFEASQRSSQDVQSSLHDAVLCTHVSADCLPSFKLLSRTSSRCFKKFSNPIKPYFCIISQQVKHTQSSNARVPQGEDHIVKSSSSQRLSSTKRRLLASLHHKAQEAKLCAEKSSKGQAYDRAEHHCIHPR